MCLLWPAQTKGAEEEGEMTSEEDLVRRWLERVLDPGDREAPHPIWLAEYVIEKLGVYPAIAAALEIEASDALYQEGRRS